MLDQTEPKLAKWPFLTGDILLLGAAYFIYTQSDKPMGLWQMVLVVLCAGLAAWFGILPFVLEYRALVKVAEAGALATVVNQVQKVETLAAQISAATGQWLVVQEQADKTAACASGIAERMAAEGKAFMEFMERANTSEKATLRLEVEKLRRAEADWLQVLVRTLDHVYALQQGAVRSGQPKLIEQLSNFQNACRDAARRVGLTPFTAQFQEPFDGQRHQVLDGDAKPAADAVIEQTVATGFTFQGRMLRPALVRLRDNGAAVAEPMAAPADESGPAQLGTPAEAEPQAQTS
jgi:molecular chaperone GrpE (heat shock protein)